MDWLIDDPAFGPAWLDVDEWRQDPLRHRYVHGGFGGTGTRFEICFPEPVLWRGRMLQFLGGGQGGRENGDWLRTRGLPTAASEGAYYVSCNQGWRAGEDPVPGDLTILGYRANAQTARYSARLAETIYGRPPEFRYVFGWSGGGDRSINAMEHTRGVYHGAVAGGIVIEDLCWAAWSLGAWAAPRLRDSVPAIVDALDPGGSGDPFAVLQTKEQRELLSALYRSGFPRGAEILLTSPGLYGAGWYYVPQADPTYFTDFWARAGYAGHDGEARRSQGGGKVLGVFTRAELEATGHRPLDPTLSAAELPADATVGLRLQTDVAPADLIGAHVYIARGPRAGSHLLVASAFDDIVLPALASPGPLPHQEGDTVVIDNGDWLAYQHYHRYAEQRRGTAMEAVAGLPYTGVYEGKLILIQAAQDHPAMTASGHLYARQVADRDRFRCWWIDNADHGPPSAPGLRARFVDFWPTFVQGLRDMIAWVEGGIAPPPSTSYERGDDGILRFEPTAPKRGGIQPVVTLTANGHARAEVQVGEPVTLEGVAEVPAGAGSVTQTAWDPTGSGEWPLGEDHVPQPRVKVTIEHAYAEPGTYFPGVRASAHRDGLARDWPALIENIARARVVVRGDRV